MEVHTKESLVGPKNAPTGVSRTFYSLSKENQFCLLRTLLLDPGSESKISRLRDRGGRMMLSHRLPPPLCFLWRSLRRPSAKLRSSSASLRFRSLAAGEAISRSFTGRAAAQEDTLCCLTSGTCSVR